MKPVTRKVTVSIALAGTLALVGCSGGQSDLRKE